MAKKVAKKKTAAPRKARKITRKSAAKKTSARKNKLGVANSLVNNINARKKRRISRPKKKSTVSKKSYSKMKRNWK